GTTICIYGGIMRRYADKIMDVLNPSHYIISVRGAPTYSSFGLEIHDDTLEFKPIQKEYPSFAPFSHARRVLGNEQQSSNVGTGTTTTCLSSIKDIKGLGPEITKLLLHRLSQPAWHPTVQDLKSKLTFPGGVPGGGGGGGGGGPTTTLPNKSGIRAKNLLMAMKYLGPTQKPSILFKGMFIPPPPPLVLSYQQQQQQQEEEDHNDDDEGCSVVLRGPRGPGSSIILSCAAGGTQQQQRSTSHERLYMLARGKALLNRIIILLQERQQQQQNGKQAHHHTTTTAAAGDGGYR
ncbi:hypothetical protein FOZ62_024413, partial [Perkinsus olseni]